MFDKSVRWVILVLVCALFGAGALIIRQSQLRASGADWQCSQELLVRLGVRDKYGELGKYTAVFWVVAPNRKQFRATKLVTSDEWAYVSFPDDFPTWGQPGQYTWKCFVGGKLVAGGAFECRGTGSGERVTSRSWYAR